MQSSDPTQVGREISSEEDWRDPLLNTALRLTAILGLLWLVAYLASLPEMRKTPETGVLVLTLLAVFIAALRPTLPEPIRLAALQVIFFVPVLVSYTFQPPTAGTGIVLALLVLVSTLYYGLRAGIILTAIIFVVTVAAGFGWASGFLPWHPRSDAHWELPLSWVRVSVAQSIGTLAVCAVALYVVRHAQKSSRELARNEQLLRTVLAASNDGIWEWDFETGIIKWSDRVYDILQLKRDGSAMTIDRLRELVHPDDREMFSNALENHLQAQKPFNIENRFRRGDGSYGHFLGRGGTIKSASGKPVRMVGSVSDVTERRRMDNTLKASEALLRQFVKHTPAAVAMFDTEMRYIQVSDRWLMDYRLDAAQLVGQSHYEVFPDLPERWKQIHQRVLRGAVEHSDEDCFTRADGRSEWLQWDVQPWHDAHGKIGGLIMFTLLVNDRKRAEQKIIEQLTELQRWQRVTLGREERSLQLKREVNELRIRLNEPPRYGAQTLALDHSSEPPNRRPEQ